MIDTTKTVADIACNEPFYTFPTIFSPNRIQCCVASPIGTETVRGVAELRTKVDIQNQTNDFSE
ncbi:hypothetical protein UNSWDHB_2 [Dehalobacter sp. UNSWDHB]|uniref:hypothetical protein n=1 Tax=unclassified Dehalobacter TaxID=2635733 RepID=UPI00028AD53F|nr:MULTISPECIES: hypothetical protein [unclassified Dehalobacter]AFV02251.1 hypothetical protein DHBDCA_p1222 [Dehalobacter sp. DCA]AFV05293.1 hypothetical protein DCF50_p1287 [Dehalobacter sp. CF]EQB22664.1 hypothetical protein UNSWDHB_2 [Dehalobacter sp. UNSWDHB]MDJ0306663.1 hypothetical protein [Dehalobacter sp.]